MPISDRTQAILVGIGAGGIGISTYIATQPIPEVIKVPAAVVSFVAGLSTFVAKELLGAYQSPPKTA